MTALLRIRHGAEGLALSPVDAAPDGIAQYARRHKVRRQNLVLFHFQTPEGRKTGIAFVPHAGARTFVKVFPAVGAQPLAIRLAQRTYRKGEHKLFPEQAGQIDLRRAVHQLDDELVGLAVERLFFAVARLRLVVRLWERLEAVETAVDDQVGVFGATVTGNDDLSLQVAAYKAAVFLGKKRNRAHKRLDDAAIHTAFRHGDRPDGRIVHNERLSFRGDVVQCNP